MSKIKLLLLNLGLLQSLYSDQRFGKWSKLITVIAVIYLVSPIDLVFDFTPVIGLLDDLAVVVTAILSIGKLLSGFKKQEKVY